MASNPFEVSGKRIIVTGASSGIGRAVAVQLSDAGAEVLINGRDADRLEVTRKSMPAVDVEMIIGDLNEESCIEQLSSIERPLDGLVHCAGKIHLLPFTFQNEDAIREVMEVNYFAPVRLIHSLLKAKKFRKPSSIVLLSSVTSSERGTGGGSIYGSSKGALEGLVRSLALELGRNRIRVNTVAPGMVETEGVDELRKTLSAEALKKDVQKYPLGRYGSPSDIALSCQFLLSDASAWITGTRLLVDGGLSTQA